MGRSEVTSTWQQIWIDRKGSLHPPTDRSPIFDELKSIVGNFRGKKILEPGSGIGEISIDVAGEGGDAFLLDVSREALDLSKKFFEGRALTATYILGDMFHMPFADGMFDVVWNAGVVEHFRFDDQVSALKEFARVTRPGGLIITFNPNARARLYRWGKRVGEERGTWEFGEEYPVETMESIAAAAGLRLEDEHSFFFERSISFLRYVSPVVFRLYKSAYQLTGGSRNAFWQKRYGGYLLASVMRKP